MKQIILTTLFTVSCFALNAQTKKDGTPDMRYKANQQTYQSTPSYTTPSNSTTNNNNYNNGGQLKVQSGYTKSNGTYVQPHIKSTPDNSKSNNWNTYKPKN